jgi:hypothetical protein
MKPPERQSSNNPMLRPEQKDLAAQIAAELNNSYSSQAQPLIPTDNLNVDGRNKNIAQMSQAPQIEESAPQPSFTDVQQAQELLNSQQTQSDDPLAAPAPVGNPLENLNPAKFLKSMENKLDDSPNPLFDSARGIGKKIGTAIAGSGLAIGGLLSIPFGLTSPIVLIPALALGALGMLVRTKADGLGKPPSAKQALNMFNKTNLPAEVKQAVNDFIKPFVTA